MYRPLSISYVVSVLLFLNCYRCLPKVGNIGNNYSPIDAGWSLIWIAFFAAIFRFIWMIWFKNISIFIFRGLNTTASNSWTLAWKNLVSDFKNTHKLPGLYGALLKSVGLDKDP